MDASAIPPARGPIELVPETNKLLNIEIIPVTVPKRPNIGETEAIVPNNVINFSSLFISNLPISSARSLKLVLLFNLSSMSPKKIVP